ncbi:MAG: radical SAM protein [Deltaproteobacteria bacterium]|nr:radical SAM protein [Deltaproteobacteria bacterium]
MGWKITSKIEEILARGGSGEGIDRDQAWSLMRVPLQSRDGYALMETANRLSRERFHNKGENHFHIGVNVEPCPFDCRFCSLTAGAGIFTERIRFSEAEILGWAREAEMAGADGLNIMTTGTFSFERLLEIGRLLSREVSTPLVANTRDLTHKEAERLLEAGFAGAYHAVRLGEGRDTPFRVKRRIRTIRVLRDVGLLWMNCVEPVGPEHGIDEIIDRMFLAREHGAVYSGIMRRINFPGSPMTGFGMISELEMAHMVAVSRLVMGDVCRAHCTHEPHAASLLAGANLFFPEVGASPRDGGADTGKGRGRPIQDCRRLHREMGWNPDRPSNVLGVPRVRDGRAPLTAL